MTGIDGVGLFESESTSARWLDTTVDLASGVARIDVYWRHVAQGDPANPSDAADPAYDFGGLDRAVQGAAARGLRVILTFVSAPNYGQVGGGNPQGSSLPPGAWKPIPEALGTSPAPSPLAIPAASTDCLA